jgi:hypothetical protein
LHAVVEDDPSVITLFVGAAMTVVPGIRSHADTDVGAIPDLPRLHDPCELDPSPRTSSCRPQPWG